MALTAKRIDGWISPALLERLTKTLQPQELQPVGSQAHEIFINVGYNKALTDIRYSLKYREGIDIPVKE